MGLWLSPEYTPLRPAPANDPRAEDVSEATRAVSSSLGGNPRGSDSTSAELSASALSAASSALHHGTPERRPEASSPRPAVESDNREQEIADREMNSREGRQSGEPDREHAQGSARGGEIQAASSSSSHANGTSYTEPEGAAKGQWGTKDGKMSVTGEAESEAEQSETDLWGWRFVVSVASRAEVLQHYTNLPLSSFPSPDTATQILNRFKGSGKPASWNSPSPFPTQIAPSASSAAAVSGIGSDQRRTKEKAQSSTVDNRHLPGPLPGSAPGARMPDRPRQKKVGKSKAVKTHTVAPAASEGSADGSVSLCEAWGLLDEFQPGIDLTFIKWLVEDVGCHPELRGVMGSSSASTALSARDGPRLEARESMEDSRSGDPAAEEQFEQDIGSDEVDYTEAQQVAVSRSLRQLLDCVYHPNVLQALLGVAASVGNLEGCGPSLQPAAVFLVKRFAQVRFYQWLLLALCFQC